MAKTTRKTLANCDLPDFMRQAYQTAQRVDEFYKKVDIPSIRDSVMKKYGLDAEHTDEERKSLSDIAGTEFVREIMTKLMMSHADELVEMIGIAAFMDYESAKKLSFTEAFEILSECFKSKDVMDFFISAAKLGGNDSAGILVMWIFIRQAFSEEDSSSSESQSSTEDTVSELPAPATSQTD